MSLAFVAIAMEKPNIYYAGNTIRGKVALQVIDAVHPDSLTLHFDGTSNVAWTETETAADGNTGESTARSVAYSSSNKLLSLSHNLTGNSDGLVKPGTYGWPFEFHTPPSLPSSFKGLNGAVTYKLHLKGSDVSVEVNIVQPIDPNWQQLAVPVSAKDRKTMCCMICCDSGKVTMTAKTDRTAYCPGEQVSLTVTFVNLSRHLMKPDVELVRDDEFLAEGRLRTHKKVWSVRHEAERIVKEGDAGKWVDLLFQVPQCSPSIKTENISAAYFIKVSLDISVALKLTVALPVVIGTIPFRGHQPVTTTQVRPSVPLGPHEATQAAKLDPHEKDISPPSYFEAVLTRTDLQ